MRTPDTRRHSTQLALPLDGPALRDQALDRLAAARAEWLTRAIVAAHALIYSFGEVTADDIHQATPIPDGIDPRVMGAVFRGRFRVLRHQPSRRSSRHACPIPVWGRK